jgi:hypothetical protein
LREPGDEWSGVSIGPPAEHDLVADAAVADHENPIGMGCGSSIVGDEHYRLA